MKKTLFNKLSKEYADFKQNIICYNSEQVYNIAYEIVIKQQIFDILISEEIPWQVEKILISKENALDYLYEIWQRTENYLADNIRCLILSEQNLLYYDNI